MLKNLHLKSVVLLLMLLVGANYVFADEKLFYTLTPASGSNNAYDGNCDVEISNIKWNLEGNSTTQPWRIGGKSITKKDRSVTSKTAMGSAISKVDLTVGEASSITVNSLKLTVASDANFSNKIDEVTATFKASSVITFKPSASVGTEWPTGAFYKFTFNVTVSGSSNKFVQFTKAEFYANEAESDEGSISASPATVSLDAGEHDGTIAVTYKNIADTGVEVVFVESDGTTVAKYEWVDAEIDSDNNVYYTVGANTGDERTAYLKVYGLDNEANDIYSNLITITQEKYVEPALTEDGVFDFESKNFDYGSGVETTKDGQTYIYDAKTWTAGNVTLVTSGKYRWWDNDGTLRFYNNNPASTMTISVPAGYLITSITIAGALQWKAEGYTSSDGKWSGLSQEVTLTMNSTSSQNVKTVTVTYVEAVPVSISAVGLATFSSAKALDFSLISSVYAYIATLSGTTVNFTRVNKIPANTGVLLRNPEGAAVVENVYVPVLSGEADAVAGNALVAVADDIERLETTADDGSTNYILYAGASGVGFYRAAGNKVAAGKAYLNVPKETAVRSFIGFDDDTTTGLSLSESDRTKPADGVYDLQGRRMEPSALGREGSTLKKGLYIVNGKKVVIK